MRRDTLAVLTVVLTVGILAAPACLGGASAEEGDTVTVYGYVADISNEGNVPLEGVEIDLRDILGTVIGSAVTDSDGMFEFEYAAGTVVLLNFSYNAYTVRSVNDRCMEIVGDTLVKLDISGLEPEADGRYAVSGSSAIGMRDTTGEIYGYVQGTYNGSVLSLEEATVTFVSSSGRVYTTKTDSNGYFMCELPYGTYSVYATCNGFQPSEAVSVGTSSEAVTITLEQNQAGFVGLDTPHALMLVGLVLVGLVLLTVFLIMRKSKEPESELALVDDLVDEDETERP